VEGVLDMLDRFARQRGLVDQDVVRDIRIATDSLSKPLNEALVTIAEQLGIGEFPCSIDEAEYIIHTSGVPVRESKSTIPISYGGDGVFLDGRVTEEEIHPIYEPAVATIAACLSLNEVLRRAGAFLPVEIPKVSVSVNVRVDESSMLGPLKDINMSLEGHPVSTNIRPIKDGTGHRRVMLRLNDDDPLTLELHERLKISGGRDGTEPRHPVIEFNLEPPSKIPEGHVTLVGAGGLGTWVLKTMVAGLSGVEAGPLSILVFDGDMEVESHNLNRQVIFTEDDIGKSKVDAASDWIQKNLPDAEIKIAYELANSHLEEIQLANRVDDDSGTSFDELGGMDVEVPASSIIDDDEVCSILKQTNVILGCLDAMRPRTLADLAAARMDQPYINAGVQGLEAEYREFQDSSLVSIYGPKTATDITINSCQEDGDVPVASIVLTNALVASFQAIAALQRLCGSSFSSVASVSWRLRLNEILCIPSKGEVARKQYVAGLESALWPRSSMDDDSNPAPPQSPEVEG